LDDDGEMNVEGVGWRGEIPIGEGEGEFQCAWKGVEGDSRTREICRCGKENVIYLYFLKDNWCMSLKLKISYG